MAFVMTLTTTTTELHSAIMMVVIAAKNPNRQTATNIVSSAIVLIPEAEMNAKIYGKRKNALKGRRRTNAISRG